MFLEHFKLSAQPFGVTPDARFLYLSQTHREALASLLYGIHSERGFVALIAAPGMGKTTLAFRLFGLLATNAKTAFLFRTLCGPEEFLRALLADLEIDDEGGGVARMHEKLNAYLFEQSKTGRQVVLVIDEAQNLDERVLEMVRMLSNFETPAKKLMHIVLSGQPQLAEKLASERLTQLRQRISVLARLAPFSAAETREYIDHRLQVAGATAGHGIFSTKAYGIIAEQSEGIPRNINTLCFNSMSIACALKKSQVDEEILGETTDDLNLDTVVHTKSGGGVPVLQGSARERFRVVPRWRRLASALGLSFLAASGLYLSFGATATNLSGSESAAISSEPDAETGLASSPVAAHPAEVERAVPAESPSKIRDAVDRRSLRRMRARQRRRGMSPENPSGKGVD